MSENDTKIIKTKEGKVILPKYYKEDYIEQWLAEEEHTYFFSYYNLWNVAENDSTPCIWASNKDLCNISKQGVQTIALTVDIRNKLWVKFWDNITMKKSTWETYTVQIHDEMNVRYRTGCIKREWYCVKWDIAYYWGKSINGMWQGIYTITK